MKLHYIWDAYCGWCYGFGPALNEFTGHHPELDVSVTSGGLFAEDRVLPVSQFGFMKAGNEQIKAIYGSEFSEAYNDLLDEGSTIINSNHPATALSVLKKYVAPEQLIEFAHAMQKQFFIQGKSLSDIATYADLFEDFAIPAQAQNELRAQWQDYSLAEQDFQQARAWGVTSYPTELAGITFDIIGDDAHRINLYNAEHKVLIGGIDTFNEIHIFLADTSTEADLQAWAQRLDSLLTLELELVVPSHADPDGSYDRKALEATRDYLFEVLEVLGNAQDSATFIKAMTEKHPSYLNKNVLTLGAKVLTGEMTWG